MAKGLRLDLHGENLSPVEKSLAYRATQSELTFPKLPYKTWRTLHEKQKTGSARGMTRMNEAGHRFVMVEPPS